MRGAKPTFAYLFSTLVMLLLTEISFGGQAFAQMKEYKDQFGRFSIQVPQDWKIDPPTIKKDSIGISFFGRFKRLITYYNTLVLKVWPKKQSKVS